MADLDKKVKVVNRTDGMLGYSIPELRIKRFWRKPGDYLNISVAEMLELKTVPGGMALLEDCVVIEDEEAIKLVFDDKEMEPEYRYGLKEVDFLLYEATLEQFLDALDYSPQGVLDLIKANAKKKLPNTTAKISAINDKFNIDMNKIHELGKPDADEEQVEEKPVVESKRRAAPIIEEIKTAPAKEEVKAPKYNIVEKDKK